MDIYSRVENPEDFYIHVTLYGFVNIVLFVMNLVTYSGNWWFLYPLCDWGIGILIHALTTFVTGSFEEILKNPHE